MYHHSSRLQRIVSRIASRFFDYSPLLKAKDEAEMKGVADTMKIQCFNGNVRRTKIVQALLERGGCTHFVETGTSHAATAIAAHRLFGLPLHTCEINPKDYRVSKLMTAGLSNMTLYNADCIGFLRSLAAKDEIKKGVPFFYLDAHEGELDSTSLPLEEEIRNLLSLDSFVVLIDDFIVPGEPGYVHGSYGGRNVELDLIRRVLAEGGIETCYFPGYAPEDETGHRSGYCVFWRNAALDREMEHPSFPLAWLRAYDPQATEAVA